MNPPRSEHPQFTLRQLLLTVTVIAMVLAIAAQWLRSPMAAEFGSIALEFMKLVGPLTPIMLILLALAFGLALALGIAAIRSRRTSAALRLELFAHGVGMIGVLALFVVVVPAFTRMFKEFDVALPRTTYYLVMMSDMVARYALLVIPLMAAFVVIDFMTFRQLHDSPRDRPWARIWSAAITASFMAIFTLTICALFAPLFCVVRRLTDSSC